jgi:hypothetical protein
MFNANDVLVAELSISGAGVLRISTAEHGDWPDKSTEREASITGGVTYES